MNPETPPKPPDEFEARLTALLLGELPHDQAAALHQKLAQDAELAKLYERLKLTIVLVRETVAQPAEQTPGQPAPLKLSDQRREKLLQHFKTVAPKAFAKPQRRGMPWLVPVGIAAAVVAILGALLLPATSRSKSKALTLLGPSLMNRVGSLPEEAESAAPASPPANTPQSTPMQIERRLRFQHAKQSAPPQAAPGQIAAGQTTAAYGSPPPAASPVIVLPQGSELVDAATPPPSRTILNGITPPGVASKRLLSADSFDRVGGRSGGGGLGGSGYGGPSGGVRAGATPAGNDFGLRQAYVPLPPAAANGTLEAPAPMNAPLPAASAPALNFGPDGQPLPLAFSEQATGVEDAGSLHWGSDGAPSESANKLADSKDSKITLQGITTDSGIKRAFMRAAPAPAGPVSAPLAQASPLSQRIKSNPQPMSGLVASAGTSANNWNPGVGNANLPPATPSGSYQGGILLGPREAAPGGGDHYVAQNRPVLRSPKDDGLAGGGGSAAAAAAQSSSQETKALGFDWYLGKSQATQTAPAFKGTPKDAFALDDVRTTSRLSQSTPGAAGSSDKANIYNLGVVGYVNVTLPVTNSIAVAPTEAPGAMMRRDVSAVEQARANPATHGGSSPIVLPPAQPESSLAPTDGSKNVQLFAAANQPKAAPAPLADRRRQAAEDAAPLKPAASAPIPPPEVQTADNAFSTFSLNVSDVSFKLAAASLEKGVMPDPATVRSEEFINAFDYRDPEPPPGVPVAFAWERARYPFAQNRDLLRFSIKTAAQGRQPGRPLNLVLLLDNSGSMERADRVRIIHEALRVLARQLQPQDKFSVVTFARTAHLWVDGVSGSQAAQVAEEVSGLTPQGGTNLEDALNLAYQTALRHYLANGINRVVLLTDGAANLGNVDPETLKRKVEANRKQGIALDCFGIGWEGYNDDLLEVLTRNGDGRYAFLNTPEEASGEFAAKLAGALQVAASDVKAQVEFNPARVTAYRQIGYAKHQLTKEQFRDNTVNAAQIGAAEAGNALYTVEVNPNGSGPLCTVRVRFRIPGTADYREHAWDVPYTGNAVSLEQASPAMRLAAAASAFSEWLVSSPYAAEVTPDRLLGYLNGVPAVYGADARPTKLEWMIRQAKSLAGK